MRPETWIARLAHELDARGLAADRVAAIVVEAEGHLAEAGEPPLAAFGDPETYAERLADAVASVPPGPAAGGALRVSARGVGKVLGGRTVLRDASFEARAGQVVVLTGANGAGKSTLLRIAAGLLRADSGLVETGGSVGYAPQHGGVVPHLTPAEHFELFGHGRGLTRRAAVRMGELIAGELGWRSAGAPVAGRLSGGTRQKLNVALAALGDPDVLLLDEPYQGLDRDSTERFWALIDTWRDAGRAVVVVSHALEAVRHADAVVELGPAGREAR